MSAPKLRTKAQQVEERRLEIAKDSFPGRPKLAHLAAKHPAYSLLGWELAKLSEDDRLAVLLKREAIILKMLEDLLPKWAWED